MPLSSAACNQNQQLQQCSLDYIIPSLNGKASEAEKADVDDVKGIAYGVPNHVSAP